MRDRVLTALRFTVAATDYAFATDTTLRSGAWHEAYIMRAVALTEPYTDELGIARQGAIEIGLADPEGTVRALSADLDGLACEVEMVHQYTDDFGATQEQVRTATMQVVSHALERGQVLVRLEDLEVQQLDQLWPPHTYDADLFSDMLEAHVGRPIADIVDIGRKIPCTLLDTDPWTFAVCERPAGGAPTVLTVYRNDRIVDPSEYTVGALATGGTPANLIIIEFTQEQLDFNGGYYQIEADVQGYHSKNVVSEIARLIEAVGLTYAAGTLAAGVAWAEANKAYVACDYGRDGQRRVSAILRDLLLVARGELYRDSSGHYSIWHDQAGSASESYDEDADDLVEVKRMDCPGRPQSVAATYRPSPQDPGTLQHTITRTVTGGAQPAATAKALRYVREHETADRWLCYHALRTQHNRQLSATIGRVQLARGDIISLRSSGLLDTAAEFQVRGIRRAAGVNELTLLEHDDSIHTYTPGTLPSDATQGYQPDYSNTPPAAPSNLAITAEAVNLQDGNAVAQVTVEADMPAVNAAQIWFLATNTETDEISMAQGEEQVGGEYQAVLSGLRPNAAHTLQAWCVNAWGLAGAVLSTFDATAIGGGATDTSFDSKAYGTAPPVPSVSVRQGTGKQATVYWTWSGDINDLLFFRVYRKVSPSLTYVNVWEGRALSYTDDDFTYDKTHSYRVYAKDKWGNTSSPGSYSASYSGNVVGTDVVDHNIEPKHRSAVSVFSGPFSFAAGRDSWKDNGDFSISTGSWNHLVTIGGTGYADVLLSIISCSFIAVYWVAQRALECDSDGSASNMTALSGTATFYVW